MDKYILGCGCFGSGLGSKIEFWGQGESENEAFAIMNKAWDIGIRHFDTADAYGGGRSESMIGNWIKQTGKVPQLTTKTYNPMEKGADFGLGYDRILRQIKSSLQRLGVPQVDMYLTHRFDPNTPLEETMRALKKVQEDGLVKGFGVSNFSEDQLKEAEVIGHTCVIQNSYSLLDRKPELGMFQTCEQLGVEFHAYSPLSGGWLTGKYQRGNSFPTDSRMTKLPDLYAHLHKEEVYNSLEVLEKIAMNLNVSMAGVALAYILAKPEVKKIVIGPRNVEHFKPVEESVSLNLSPSDLKKISDLFPVEFAKE